MATDAESADLDQRRWYDFNADVRNFLEKQPTPVIVRMFTLIELVAEDPTIGTMYARPLPEQLRYIDFESKFRLFYRIDEKSQSSVYFFKIRSIQ